MSLIKSCIIDWHQDQKTIIYGRDCKPGTSFFEDNRFFKTRFIILESDPLVMLTVSTVVGQGVKINMLTNVPDWSFCLSDMEP